MLDFGSPVCMRKYHYRLMLEWADHAAKHPNSTFSIEAAMYHSFMHNYWTTETT